MDTSKLMSLIKSKKSDLKQKDKTIKPAPGANRYVLLPGWRPTEPHIFSHDFGQHYVKNAAGEIQAVYPCLDKIFGSACPVCDGLNKAIRMTSDDETVALLKDAGAGQSYLINVLQLDGTDAATPQILEIRKTAFVAVMEMVEEWAAGLFDADNPQIFVINRDGKGLNTKYSVAISPKKHPMPAGALAKLPNLDEYVKQASEEQMRRALSAINNVAGIIGAPSGSDRPTTPLLTSVDDEATLHALAEGRKVAAAKPVASDVALDDELDDLLGDLDATAKA